jgi:H+-transporting ATPase
MNAIVGFREEYQAGNVIQELKWKLAVQARVKREGKWIVVPGRKTIIRPLRRLSANFANPFFVGLSVLTFTQDP